MVTDIQASVKEQALSLPIGCSERGVCPKCGCTDGAFNISRSDSEIRYICFHASCGCKGVIGSISSEGEAVAKPRIKKLFTDPLTSLTVGERQWLMDEFLIEESWLEAVRFNEYDERVYYPQYDMFGTLAGYIARFYPLLCSEGQHGAKAVWKPVVSYDTGLLFPCHSVVTCIHDTKQVCLVEDMPSTLRINSQFNLTIPTCCLGGTNIYDRHVDTMLALGVQRIVIALDPDAIVKAVKLERQLSLAFQEVIVLPLLHGDAKDMSYKQLDNIFKELL